ncbi:MAG: FkbM family methyltransferase [Rhodomicrobium sp.]
MEFGFYRNAPLLNALSSNRNVPGLLRQAVKAAFRNRTVDIELEGIKFRCYPSQNVHDMSIVCGTLFEEERVELSFMAKYLHDGGVLVDVGANIGALGIPLAIKAKAPLTVVAIEPNPKNVGRLRYNAQINGLTNFIVVPYAVGPSGKAKLFLHSHANSGKASLEMVSKSYTSASLDVECRPLLQILEEADVPSVTVLKIDIEGFEDKALVPFFKTAPRSLWPKAVNIERAHHGLWAEDCIALMAGSGYVIEIENKMNTMLRLS